MKKLRIAQIAPLYERVPPLLYGGTERVVSYLTEALVALGHEVTLFASGDSITKATLEPMASRATRLDKNVRDPIALHIHMLANVFERAHEFDLIHSHVDYFAYPIATTSRTPVLHTVHGRLDLPEYILILKHFAEMNFVSISDAQRAPVPTINWWGTVYHGLPSDQYRFEAKPKDYFAYLGRLSPEKDPVMAIRAAKKAGVTLRIAAKVDKADLEYFEQEVKPLLDDPNIHFLGEIDDREKQAFLGGAKGLLNTINWPEPFGIAMIEALACGTPVIVTNVGSAGELIRDKVTGYLCVGEDEFVNAIQHVDKIDRKRCREEFETRFSVKRMAKDYLEIYQSLTKRKTKR